MDRKAGERKKVILGMGKEETNKERNFDLGLREVKASLHEKINLYKTRAREVEQYLSKKPEEWGKFQNEANLEIDGIFRDIMNFEKINLNNGCGDRVYKLKHLFVKRIRKLFERGQYGKWSIIKPYGYAGDFKIIDDIYQNDPSTTGFDRLLDNYFQMSAISVAVRNRKEDFKRLIKLILKRPSYSN